jgi:peptidoglycan hydrolase-like protein with peptidoglycan-binding domain
MKLYIQASVGLNGKNRQSDVKIIQTLINYKAEQYPSIARLKVDGKCGPKTRKSIEDFQRKVIKMHSPDVRVDPNAKTEKALAASLTPFQINQIKTIQNQPIPQMNTTISNVTQPDQVSCGDTMLGMQYQ